MWLFESKKKISMHSEKQTQIEAKAYISIQDQSKAQIKTLLFNEISTKILVKYSNYNNFFLIENAA